MLMKRKKESNEKKKNDCLIFSLKTFLKRAYFEKNNINLRQLSEKKKYKIKIKCIKFERKKKTFSYYVRESI
jgi:hypothetical protein